MSRWAKAEPGSRAQAAHEILEKRAAVAIEEENVRTLLWEADARTATMEGDRAVNVLRRTAAA